MTSEAESGEEQLMFSRAGSHASRTATQASAWERQTTATYGLKCFALYERSGLATSWGRTLLGYLLGTAEWSSKRCYLTWRQKAIGPSRRLCFQLLVKVRHTVAIASGLSRTPTVGMLNADRSNDPEYANRKRAKGQTITLADQAKEGLLQKPQHMGLVPTPTCMDSSGATANMQSTQVVSGSMHSVTLSRALEMGILPTPSACKASQDTTLTCSGDGREKPNKLGWAVSEMMLPTPVANDDNKSPEAHMAMKSRMPGGPRNNITSLQVLSKTGPLPTPAASNPNDGEGSETWHARAAVLKEKHGNGNGAGTPLSIAAQDATGQTGRLNHRFVMEMMGFPPNWCDIPPEKLTPFVSKRSMREATPLSRKSRSKSSKPSNSVSNEPADTF